jgi:hypothetical protein
MRPGHSRPISKLRMVPDTAPTANSTPIALDHRRASAVYSALPVRMPRHSMNAVSPGSPTPKQANTMCQPNDSAICSRAATRSPGDAARASTPQPMVKIVHKASGQCSAGLGNR